MVDVNVPRKKSPRAPTIPLDEAIERVMKAYDKERLHPAPTDVVAQNLGYKGASSGSALSAMASLRYYGLLERPSDGLLAVTKDVEALKFAPEDSLKRSLILGFLRRPALFAELLEKYSTGLPSDANLKYDLIQRGFLPASASDVVSVFRRSADFARYFDNGGVDLPGETNASEDEAVPARVAPEARESAQPSVARTSTSEILDEGQYDRIPVRLRGARRAWLVIPTPFFAADKQRLKAQIDLLLSEDEEEADHQ
jgi:hypothetical protein